ncbi:glutathione synthetase isoform X4 [Drosophila sulfurigaster albostrigata]|uniref:glutathione synthetase isoform X4 n=1 Tax=Drosophila sulfurigaster albostrigata TaxID=89887 RepID=UPI002D21A003|nr:glutathione synthetase isoform X4 [Drosophila sulfurigaster albostrigata]
MSNDENTPVLRGCIKLPLANDELLEVTSKAKDYAIMHGAAMRSKTAFSPDSLNFAPFVLVPSSFPRKEFEKAIALQPIINRLMHNVAHDEEFITTTLAETIKVDEFTANLFNIYRKVLAHGFTQRISLGMLRSDLMLESCCPELSPMLHHVENNMAASTATAAAPAPATTTTVAAATAGGGGDDDDDVAEANGKVDNVGIVRATKSAYCCWKQVEINTIASGFGHLGPASKTIQSFQLCLKRRSSRPLA